LTRDGVDLARACGPYPDVGRIGSRQPCLLLVTPPLLLGLVGDRHKVGCGLFLPTPLFLLPPLQFLFTRLSSTVRPALRSGNRPLSKQGQVKGGAVRLRLVLRDSNQALDLIGLVVIREGGTP